MILRAHWFAAAVVLAFARPAVAADPQAKPSAAAAAPSHTLVDEIGRSVVVPVAARRIVSLAPAITEGLFAIGAGPQVVGVTRYCDFPAEAKTRSIVGGFADPDVERVIGLAPDLVIATSDTVTRERFDAIVALGLPVYTVNPRDLSGVAGTLRHLGELTGRREAAEASARAFETAVQAVDTRIAAQPKVRAMVLFSVDPPIAAGPSTFVDELLRHAGAANVAAGAPTSYPRYGVEGILSASPAVIFVTVPGGAAQLRKMLAGSSLATQDAVVEVDADLLERPGPRLAAGLEAIARRLHPVTAASQASPLLRGSGPDAWSPGK